MESVQDLLARRAGHARRGEPSALLRSAEARRDAAALLRIWASLARQRRRRREEAARRREAQAARQRAWDRHRVRIRDRLCRRGGAAVYWLWEWRALRWAFSQFQYAAANLGYAAWLAGDAD